MSQSPRDGRKPFGRTPSPGMWRPEARESRNRPSGYHSFCISAMTSRSRQGGWDSFPAIPQLVRGVKRPLEAYDSGRMGSEGATVMAKLIDCSYCATVSTPRSCDWLNIPSRKNRPPIKIGEENHMSCKEIAQDLPVTRTFF